MENVNILWGGVNEMSDVGGRKQIKKSKAIFRRGLNHVVDKLWGALNSI